MMISCPRISEIPLPPEGKTGWPWSSGGALIPDTMQNGRNWPRISIITPSYNQSEYLEATIRSVLLQGYPKLEFIVNDGGSTDGSQEIIRKYEPWLAHWESKPDGGQYAAVQKGFCRSTGEIMAWLNSDDMYFPWTLRIIGEVFSAFPQLRWLASSMPCELATEDGLLSFHHSPGYSRRAFFSQRDFKHSNFIQQEGCFWRKNLWDETGGYFDLSLHLAGDLELWSRFWQKADLYVVNNPLGIFRYHAGQKTSSMNGYLQEARSVMKKYPRPFPIPQILLCIIAYGLKYFKKDFNWFGVGAHRAFYSRQENNWKPEISFRTF
jgi:hypothetical protein